MLVCGKGGLALYDILWDPVFERFYVPGREEPPELTEEELEALEDGADCWLMDAAGIL